MKIIKKGLGRQRKIKTRLKVKMGKHFIAIAQYSGSVAHPIVKSRRYIIPVCRVNFIVTCECERNYHVLRWEKKADQFGSHHA